MKKIYEAVGEEKQDLIECYNDFDAFDREKFAKENINIKDILMVGSLDKELLNNNVNIHWNLNGLMENKINSEDIIIIEPLIQQINNKKLVNISEVNTYFSGPIKLSSKSIVLMKVEQYKELEQNPKFRKILDKMNIRLYEGKKEFALRMLFRDKKYIYLDITEEGYKYDEINHVDLIEYNRVLQKKQEEIVEELKREGRNVTYKNDNNFVNIDELEEIENNNENKDINIEENKKIEDLEEKKSNYKMITGLTKKTEGSIEIDNEIYASTDIGKIRDNQEDAVILMKDPEIPHFKMIAVADGVGGEQYGEIASDSIVNKLKEWFENINKNQKQDYYENIALLKESLQEFIENDIQLEVQEKTSKVGASTLVCALVGKNNTLVVNVGDSRAYLAKDGKLIQISREDTAAQENFENGKTPSKEATRFDKESNCILQCLGMNKRDLKHPNTVIINNNDYDMLLLFSDGVTDCLSEEDIAVVCRTTDKKELANKIVEKAISHDSILEEDMQDYCNLSLYIPGGKDNTTAALYVKNKDENEEER